MLILQIAVSYRIHSFRLIGFKNKYAVRIMHQDVGEKIMFKKWISGYNRFPMREEMVGFSLSWLLWTKLL